MQSWDSQYHIRGRARRTARGAGGRSKEFSGGFLENFNSNKVITHGRNPGKTVNNDWELYCILCRDPGYGGNFNELPERLGPVRKNWCVKLDCWFEMKPRYRGLLFVTNRLAGGRLNKIYCCLHFINVWFIIALQLNSCYLSPICRIDCPIYSDSSKFEKEVVCRIQLGLGTFRKLHNVQRPVCVASEQIKSNQIFFI